MKLAGSILALALACAVPALAEEDATVVPSAADAAALPRDSAEAKIIRGSIVYRTYCVLCHGASGKGDGRAAKMYTPRPANLTVSPFNDKYKEMIIRGGGVSMGRSSFMPPWGEELSEEQIHDLVAYLRELRKTGAPGD